MVERYRKREEDCPDRKISIDIIGRIKTYHIPGKRQTERDIKKSIFNTELDRNATKNKEVIKSTISILHTDQGTLKIQVEN